MVSGVEQPKGETQIQITWGEKMATLALDAAVTRSRPSMRLQTSGIMEMLFQLLALWPQAATARCPSRQQACH
jgi:hypothetical protein